jgi:vacuolar protein-sorting-associated protein 4
MARASRPAIIFIDEIESIVPSRGGSSGDSTGGGSNHMDRVVTEFLKQVDGLGINNKGILTLAATNLPWQIDKAALRRFDKRIYVPLPDAEARSKMLARDLLRAGAAPEHIIELVAATEGYSGSDIKNVLKDGDMRCLQKVLDATHFCPSPKEKGAFLPCSAEEQGAVPCSYDEWKDKSVLRCPPSTPQDYLDALQTVPSSVKAGSLQQFVDWERSK